MNIKKLLVDFVIIFVLAFVFAAIVTYLYSLIVHGAGVFNWEISFVLAIVLGIVRLLATAREHKEK